MDVLLRPIVDEELGAFVLTTGYGFGDRNPLEDHERWARTELDRTVAGFVGDEIVATGRNYSLELTLPGNVVIPAGGVSWIATRPTHRRRGLLTRIMTALIDDSRERGEPVSMLTASEGGIYPRFGYGVASRIASVAVDRSMARILAPPPPDFLRMVEPEVGVELARALFERVRRGRVGAVSRPETWWHEEWAAPEWIDARRRFDVVYEESGIVEGYALYAIEGEWTAGFTRKVVHVRDLIASSPQAEIALWSYLCNIDQTTGARSWATPLDSALPWLLSDSRQYRTESMRDFLWIRPIDTARLLASRAYGATGEVVIGVFDPFLELDETAGRFLLRSGPDGAVCGRTDRETDMEMGADALGAIALGGFPPSVLVRAGRIVVRDQTVITLADSLFRAEREPFTFTWF